MPLRKRKEIQAMLRSLKSSAVSLILLALSWSVSSRELTTSDDWDRQFSRLYAVDALGRVLPAADECGPLREGKFVGIFYFLWHGAHEPTGPWDLSEILKEDPPPFGPPGAFHHWGKPELGYYRSDDPYVFEVHAELLAAARVDTIVIDVTNGHSYRENLKVLCDTWLRLRRLGNPTPQISFLALTDQRRVVRELYDEFYSDEKYRELWFSWKGKPLMLAATEQMDESVRDFFTFRESWAWTHAGWFGDGRGKWAWLDDSPQSPGLDEDGRVEQISVSVAQHATTNKGRSYSKERQPPESQRHPERGIYFAEQWDRAMEVDPDFVFVTGWNEWVAQRFVKSDSNPHWTELAGRPLQTGDSIFVDAYSQEYSRDIEPMEGGYGRNYYYQLVDGIRRFKGAARRERLPVIGEIRLDGTFGDWANYVRFRDFKGEMLQHSHGGWAPGSRFEEEGGGIDFVASMVACGSESLFLGLEFEKRRDDGVLVELRLLAFKDQKVSETFVIEFELRGADAELVSVPGGFEAGDVRMGVSEGGLELSLKMDCLGDADGVGFAWSERLSLERYEDLSLPVDKGPVADFVYWVAVPQLEGDR